MNNPDLVCALCDQAKAEIEALQKATWNARNSIHDDTRDMFTEMQISHVVHLQNLALALTKEMTPDETADYEAQMADSTGLTEEGE